MDYSEDENDYGDYLEDHESDDDDQMEDVQSTSDNFIVEPSNDQGKI
ncbi:2299_t:CDS:1, partial [Scutellospora calospora]